MTREEEAIEELTTYLIHWRQLLHDHICPKEDGERMINALEMAIKSLKQKSVLDKVIAEIERQEKWLMIAGYNAYNVDIAFNAIRHIVVESGDKE